MGEIVIFIFVIGVLWSFISSVRSASDENEDKASNTGAERGEEKGSIGEKSGTDTGNIGRTSSAGKSSIGGNSVTSPGNVKKIFGSGIRSVGETSVVGIERRGETTTTVIGKDNVKHINSVDEQREFLQRRYYGKLFLARSAEVNKTIEEKCPYDGDILFKHDAAIRTELGTKQILRNAKCCDACDRAFVLSLNDGREKFYTQKNKLYINKRIHDCQRNGHVVVSATGVVKNIDSKEVNINVQYCAVCRKYFIEKEQFDRYRTLYGIMLGNFVYCDGLNSGYAPLMNQYSLLNLCGYNVGQKDNLSPYTRHEVLRYVIANKLMSKPDVIKHLDYYINLNSSQSSKRLAVKKWKEDLDYVNNLEINKQRKIKF